MSAARDTRVLLQHMLEEAKNAQDFLDGVEYPEYLGSVKLRHAVERSLEIIGEAAKNIPDQIRNKYPLVEWRKMTGTRDRLIHGYADVDVDLVWATVKDNLPILQEQIEGILREIDSAE